MLATAFAVLALSASIALLFVIQTLHRYPDEWPKRAKMRRLEWRLAVGSAIFGALALVDFAATAEAVWALSTLKKTALAGGVLLMAGGAAIAKSGRSQIDFGAGGLMFLIGGAIAVAVAFAAWG